MVVITYLIFQKLVDDEIKNNFNDISGKEKYIQIVVDINRYAILVVIKENWVLELDKNFTDLFGFKKIYLKKDITVLLKLEIWIKQNS